MDCRLTAAWRPISLLISAPHYESGPAFLRRPSSVKRWCRRRGSVAACRSRMHLRSLSSFGTSAHLKNTMPEFVQEEPRLGNQYDDDALLRSYLRWRLPPSMLAQIEPGLRQLGGRVVADIQALAEQVEASPPRHVPFDAWGRRIDRIETSNAWSELDRISAREGIVAAAYERAHGWRSRIHHFARLYLFAPPSALYSCPLAMTDGAARFLEVHGDDVTRTTFDHLTSREPET